MYMVMFVLSNTGLLDPLLKAWEGVGVYGVTILPSTGLARLKQKSALRDDLPLIPSLEDIMEHVENTNRTLFTIAKDDAEVKSILDATQNVVGNLQDSNTGILIVLPCAQVYGYKAHPSPK
jgi:hypothetical protein